MANREARGRCLRGSIGASRNGAQHREQQSAESGSAERQAPGVRAQPTTKALGCVQRSEESESAAGLLLLLLRRWRRPRIAASTPAIFGEPTTRKRGAGIVLYALAAGPAARNMLCAKAAYFLRASSRVALSPCDGRMVHETSSCLWLAPPSPGRAAR